MPGYGPKPGTSSDRICFEPGSNRMMDRREIGSADAAFAAALDAGNKTGNPFVPSTTVPSPKSQGKELRPGGTSSKFTKETNDAAVDLELYYKEGWTPQQRAAADEKCRSLTEANTVVVKSPLREGTASTRYKKAGNEVPAGSHVDHVQDLQLNGADALHNMSPLDASVNTSLGSQIQQRIKDFPEGTRIGKVNIKDRPKAVAK